MTFGLCDGIGWVCDLHQSVAMGRSARLSVRRVWCAPCPVYNVPDDGEAPPMPPGFVVEVTTTHSCIDSRF